MKFSLSAPVLASAWLGVFEADNPESAIAKAEGVVDVSVCHHCSGRVQDPEIDWENVAATQVPDDTPCETNERG